MRNLFNVWAIIQLQANYVDTLESSVPLPASRKNLERCRNGDPNYKFMLQFDSGIGIYWSIPQDETQNISIACKSDRWSESGPLNGTNSYSEEVIVGAVDTHRLYTCLVMKQKPRHSHFEQAPEENHELSPIFIQFSGNNSILDFRTMFNEVGELLIYAQGGNEYAFVQTPNSISEYLLLDFSTCRRSGIDVDEFETTGHSNRLLKAVTRMSKMSIVTHGAVMIFAFAWVVPMGLTITYIWSSKIMMVAWSLALMGFLIALCMVSEVKNHAHFKSNHSKVGMAVLVLASFQVLGGLTRPRKVSIPAECDECEDAILSEVDEKDRIKKRDAQVGQRRDFEIGHRAIGFITLIMGGAALFTGIRHSSEHIGDRLHFYFFLAAVCPIGLYLLVFFCRLYKPVSEEIQELMELTKTRLKDGADSDEDEDDHDRVDASNNDGNSDYENEGRLMSPDAVVFDPNHDNPISEGPMSDPRPGAFNENREKLMHRGVRSKGLLNRPSSVGNLMIRPSSVVNAESLFSSGDGNDPR